MKIRENIFKGVSVAGKAVTIYVEPELIGLSACAKVLYHYVLLNLKDGWVELGEDKVAEIKKYTNYSRSLYFTAKNELIEKKFLCNRTISSFWVNPVKIKLK